MESLENWKITSISEMAEQIVKTAMGHGFFSIWMEVFQDQIEIRQKLIQAFIGTAQDCFDPGTTQPCRRPGGKL